MKQLSKTLCLLTALVVLAGCIKEDTSDCPPPFNTQLTFSYAGDVQSPAMFSRTIDRVTLFVFDSSDGELILQKTVEKNDLRAFQGARLYLTQGDYRMVCWGNVFDDTEIRCGTLSQGRVHAPAYGAQQRIPTNDHLYFGDLNITVPAADQLPGSVTGDIPFRGAHIDMEIYVKSFGRAEDPASWPVLEIGNLMPQYDFRMNAAQPFAATYHPVVGWDADNGVAAARFQVLRFADDNPVTVTVREPSDGGVVKATVDLAKYMSENGILVEGRHEASVRMLIEFTDLGLSVSIPDWSSGSTDPEI